MTRQIITAIKTATRFKHAPLNRTLVQSHPRRAGGDDCSLGDALPGSGGQRPVGAVISTQGLESPSAAVDDASPLEADALRLSRRLVVRADGGRARVRHEDDRQRAAACEAQDPDAPADAPGLAVAHPEMIRDGHETWYRVVGDLNAGPTPVVICHGGPGAAHDYVEPIAELARDGAVRALRPGRLRRSTHLPDAPPASGRWSSSRTSSST